MGLFCRSHVQVFVSGSTASGISMLIMLKERIIRKLWFSIKTATFFSPMPYKLNLYDLSMGINRHYVNCPSLETSTLYLVVCVFYSACVRVYYFTWGLGPPCQAFSGMNHFRVSDHPRSLCRPLTCTRTRTTLGESSFPCSLGDLFMPE